MKTFFSKSHSQAQTRNDDIAKDDLYANRDYYCEGQEVRVEISEDSTHVQKNEAGVKTKKQKFTACYNMFF